VLVLASGAGLVVMAVPAPTRYADSATLGVVPVSTKADGAVAYLQDVVSRGMIVPTFATVLNADISPGLLVETAGLDPGQTGRVTYEAVPSRLGGAVEVTVTAADPASVERLGETAVELSEARILELDAYYRLEGEMAGARPVVIVPTWVAAPLAALLAVSLTGLMQSVRSFRRRDRSQSDPYARATSDARA
jgi:hypothetical protein